jgi:hypothetical protein
MSDLRPARVALHLPAGLALLERNPRIRADDIFGLFGPFNAAAYCVLLAVLQPQGLHFSQKAAYQFLHLAYPPESTVRTRPSTAEGTCWFLKLRKNPPLKGRL